MGNQIYIAQIWIDDTVEEKIKNKHEVTPEEVREALCLRQDAETYWEDHPAHGLRVIGLGTTYVGRPILAVLLPIDELDGTWVLKTARSPRD
jgi:hypothetical protein